MSQSVYAKFAYTAGDGKVYQVALYKLDVVLSVGYCVKSIEGTRFRIWATQQLRAILMSKLRMVDRIDKLENRVAVLEDGVAQLAEAFSEPEPFLPENRELIGFNPMQKGGEK